jgi:preprotein translocase subunit SecD
MVAAISIAALGYGIWVRGPTLVFAAVRFEMRLAGEQPLPGLIVAQVSESNLIYLHPELVLSNDDIAQSWVSQEGQTQFAVAVQFLPSGAQRIRQATAAHIGRPVAILIDGRVVMAPVVRSPIRDSAMITGRFTRAEAERIADGIAGR